MKLFIRNAFIILLGLQAILAQAELYSWVDKNGKKHYGDKVPAEYAKQVQTIEVKKANSMGTPPAVGNYDNYNSPNENDVAAENAKAEPNAGHGDEGDTSCEAQKQAYAESTSCFSKCRTFDGNVSGCGQCKNVKKPNCD